MEFNHELVSGRNEDHDELAEIIAQFVDNDATEPIPANDWRSDREIRELEKPVGHHLGKWAELADVFRRAAEIAGSPSGKALLLLEELGGERRISPPNEDMIMSTARKIEEAIQLVPQGDARHMRLDTLYDYNMGIVAREVTGDYLLAAELQKKSERKAVASGDLVGAAISRLCIQVERFNHALSISGDTASLFGPLHLAAAKVVEICVSNTDERQIRWKYWNAPAHVLQAHIWSITQVPIDDKNFFVKLFFRLLPVIDTGHYKKMLPTIVSIEAGLALLEGRRDEAVLLANDVLAGEYDIPRDDGRITAFFVKAFAEDRNYLRQIVEKPGIMHQVKRRAQAILDGRVPFVINSLD